MHPLIDTQTEASPVSLSDRPVVALSAGLADALRHCSEAGQLLTLVTPDTSRLTFPLRLAAMSGALAWVVRTEGGEFYDGLTGVPNPLADAPLRPDAGRGDEADGTVHDTWLDRPTGDGNDTSQLVCTVTVQHRATNRLRLDAAEVLCQAVTGRAPLGWGTSEPVAQHWDVAPLTAFARRRAPQPTRLVAVGVGFVAVIAVTRTSIGVQEDVTALIAGGAGDQSSGRHAVDAARAALVSLAQDRTVGFAAVHHRRGRRDLTTPARFESPPTPAAVLIGPRACRQLGIGFLESAPLAAPQRVGHERLPGLLWSIDGSFEQAWEKVRALVEHIGPQRLAEFAPGLGQSGPPGT